MLLLSTNQVLPLTRPESVESEESSERNYIFQPNSKQVQGKTTLIQKMLLGFNLITLNCTLNTSLPTKLTVCSKYMPIAMLIPSMHITRLWYSQVHTYADLKTTATSMCLRLIVTVISASLLG